MFQGMFRKRGRPPDPPLQIGGYDRSSHDQESNQIPGHQLRDAPRQWCESTLLEDLLRAALRVISALSALRCSKMIFRRFAQSRITFSEKLRNTPSIIFSDLLESSLHWEICFIHKVFRDAVWDEKVFKKFMFCENDMK